MFSKQYKEQAIEVSFNIPSNKVRLLFFVHDIAVDVALQKTCRKKQHKICLRSSQVHVSSPVCKKICKNKTTVEH